MKFIPLKVNSSNHFCCLDVMIYLFNKQNIESVKTLEKERPPDYNYSFEINVNDRDYFVHCPSV